MQFYFPFIIISAAFGLALNGTDRACGEITAQFLAASTIPLLTRLVPPFYTLNSLQGYTYFDQVLTMCR